MPTELEYQARVKNFTWTDLKTLWDAIENGDTPGWDDGKALEYLILKSFSLSGAEVRWPYSVKLLGAEIEQIDGFVHFKGVSCLIECKDYSTRSDGTIRKKNVNFEPIAKLRNQLMRRPSATIGSIFSSGGFTDPAQTLINFTFPQTILTWTGAEIEYCLGKKDL